MTCLSVCQSLLVYVDVSQAAVLQGTLIALWVVVTRDSLTVTFGSC